MTDDLAALEAQSAADITTAPAVAPAPMAAPVPGAPAHFTVDLSQPLVQTDDLTHHVQPEIQVPNVGQVSNLSSPQPPATPQPQAPVNTPTAPALPVTAPSEPSAPAVNTDLRDKSERRIYLHEGLTEEQRYVARLIDANPGLSMAEIMAAATAKFGTPQTQQIPAPQHQPQQVTPDQPPARTYETASSRLQEIEAQMDALDHIADADVWKTLDKEHRALTRELPALLQQQHTAQTTADAQVDAQLAQNIAAVGTMFPQLTGQVFDLAYNQPQAPLTQITDPFAQRVAAQIRADVATGNPALDLPNYEHIVASQVALQFGILPAGVQPYGTPAPTPAPAPAQPVAPAQAAPQQMPHPQTPPPAQLAAPPAPSPYSVVQVMPPVSGVHSTSPAAVTTAPVDPQAQIASQYQQALAAGNLDALESLTALQSAAGPAPQQLQQGYPGAPAMSISYAPAA